MSSLDINSINVGLPTDNTYNTVSDSSDPDGELHSDTKGGYAEVDPGTKPYIDKPDETAKYRTSLGSTDNITDINNTDQFARYLFVKQNEVGINGIASTEFMQKTYQQQGAASIFFTIA